MKKELFCRWEIILFLIAVGYIFFFTSGVSPFWEEQLYQSDYVQESTLHWVKEIFFSFGANNILDAERPFDALLFKGLFAITGYNYFLMRFFKALLFGIFVLLMFMFVKKYMKNKTAAYGVSLFIMCSFSLYIHTLVFAEPYLLTEALKLGIFILFLKDYLSEKTSYYRQLGIGLLFLLSIRAYLPAYSTMGILIGFVLFHNWKRLKDYALLFLFFVVSAIPYPLSSQIGGGMALTPKLWSIQNFFFTDMIHYIISPMISFETLYYKPLFALFSFFGFWLIIIFFVLFCFRSSIASPFGKYFEKESEENTKERESQSLLKGVDSRMLALFFVIWFFAELPLWIILPEHATRYATSILIPFCLLVTLMILHVFVSIKKDYRRVFAIFALTLLFLAIMTNLAYVFAFRAGWGSSFIAIEKTQDFIAADKEGKTLAIYFGQSVAEEYYAINKSSTDHTFVSDLHFMQLKSVDGFDEETLSSYKNLEDNEKNYETIYIIKRVTSGGNGLPDVNFASYDSLELVTVIEGTKMTDPFDFFLAREVFDFLHYEPNYVYVYQLH